METPAPVRVETRPMRRPQPSVADLLQDLIIAKGLRPGDRLPTENELVAEIGAGRGGIREALRGLQALGVVEFRPGLGMYLRPIGLEGLAGSLGFWARLLDRLGSDAIGAIGAVRERLELASIGDVVGKHSEEQYRRMGEVLEKMRARAWRGEYSPELDCEFHLLVFEPSDNWVLRELIVAFWEVYVTIPPTFQNGTPDEVVDWHQRVLDSLRSGSVELAHAAMQFHFHHDEWSGLQS